MPATSGGLGQRRHVEPLMGSDPAHQFEFIQNSAAAVEEAIDAYGAAERSAADA